MALHYPQHAASNRFLNTDIWLGDAERTLRGDWQAASHR